MDVRIELQYWIVASFAHSKIGWTVQSVKSVVLVQINGF